MTNEEILGLFKESKALLEGHYRLTSGLHSPNYFQCAKVLQHPAYAEKLCFLIADHFREFKIDAVMAPALGGIVVGQEVGRLLGVRSMFAERTVQIMQLRRGFEIARGERILVCEDVVTTGGSVREVIEIVESLGGVVAGVGIVVDRSGGKAAFENLFATMTMEVVTYKQDDCLMCKEGIWVEKPGSRPGA